VGGLWKYIKYNHEVIKTEAHRTLGEARESDDLENFHGNYLADIWAKKAAAEGAASKETIELRKETMTELRGYYTAVAKRLAMFPNFEANTRAGTWVKIGGKRPCLINSWWRNKPNIIGRRWGREREPDSVATSATDWQGNP